MRRFPTLCLVLGAVLCALAPAARAQMVRDSIPIVVRQTYDETITTYRPPTKPPYDVGTCTHNFVGVFPDVLGRKGLPRAYSAVADGPPAFFGLSGYVGNNYLQKYIPEGYIAFGSNVGSSASWAVSDPQPNYSECGRLRGYYASEIGKMPPYYAVYSLPNGTPLALFEYDAGNGLSVAFDASFESRQSRELDASAPGGKRPVVGYAWDFGDGQTGSGARPTHVYADTGRYTVTLTVTDDDGQTDRLAREVHVQKPGLLVWAERAAGTPAAYRKGDTLSVTTWVENRSDEIVVNVKVPLTNSFVSTFPDSLLGASLKTNPAYKRVSQAGQTTATIPDVPPGERRSVTVQYRVESYAQYRGPKVYQVAPTETFPTIHGVTGEQGYFGGPPARVADKCAPDKACGETWTVAPALRLAVEYRVDNAPTAQARSGVRYNPALRSPELRPYNLPAVQPFTFALVDGTLTRFCHTACTDVRAIVLDEHTDAPVEGVTVTLTVPETPPANVTPDHSGGHLCYRATGRYSCAKTITLRTDARGQVNAYYAFPGLVEPATVNVTVELKDGALLLGSEAPPLRLLPTERTDFNREITVSAAEQAFLNTTETALNAGYYYNGIGEACEGMGKAILPDYTGAGLVRPSTSTIPSRAANVLAEWLCTLNPLGLLGDATAGNAKKFAETAFVAWFGSRFLPPDAGLGILNGPFPPPFVLYYDGDYYGAVLESAQAAGNLNNGTGGRGRLELYETSWLQMESLGSGNPFVPNAYFRFTYTGPGAVEETVEKTIELGYDHDTWMTPSAINPVSLAASAGDDALSLGPAPRADDASEDASAALAGSPAADSTIRPGTFLILETPDGAFEVAQVRSVEPGAGGGHTLRLTRPLQAAYGVGSRVHVRPDSAGVAVPARPLLATRDSVTASAPLTFAWRTGVYDTPQTFDVEVARDTAFASPLRRVNATTARTLDYGAVTDGEVFFWRVRARNLVGTGGWSRPVRVVASNRITTNTEAPPGAAEALALSPPMPNPASDRAAVTFALPVAEAVRVSVYDLLGREVAVLVDETRAAGRHVAAVPAATLSPGMYVVRLVAGAERRTQRLVVVR